jgi:hypothetical protein
MQAQRRNSIDIMYFVDGKLINIHTDEFEIELYSNDSLVSSKKVIFMWEDTTIRNPSYATLIEVPKDTLKNLTLAFTCPDFTARTKVDDQFRINYTVTYCLVRKERKLKKVRDNYWIPGLSRNLLSQKEEFPALLISQAYGPPEDRRDRRLNNINVD